MSAVNECRKWVPLKQALMGSRRKYLERVRGSMGMLVYGLRRLREGFWAIIVR